MANERILPAACQTMAEVRHGVDRLDDAIVTLLAERFRYMEAAARIKTRRSAVRDETRKAAVIGNVRRMAAAAGIPADAIAQVYDVLVEASIAFEFEWFDARRCEPEAPIDEA